jgi:lipoyl-dependent peroxiredoxin
VSAIFSAHWAGNRWKSRFYLGEITRDEADFSGGRLEKAALSATLKLTPTGEEFEMKRHATAVWSGDLKTGKGNISAQSGALTNNPYSFNSRFEDESGKSATNPEELLAAAHASCFAMQLSHFLAENGTTATKIEATAHVELVPGTGVTGSALTLTANVPGISDAKFQELAAKAKAECPISKALGAINVTLTATLG